MKTIKNSIGQVFAQIDVETKKGHVQQCLFSVKRCRIYPRLVAKPFLEWEHDDNVLFSSYGNNPKYELPDNYDVALLKTGIDVEDLEGSRVDHAGYNGNEGTMVYRGLDLGELCFTFENRTFGGWYCRFERFSELTAGQKLFLNGVLCGPLSDFVEEHRETLRAEAIQFVRDRINRELNELRAAVVKVEAKALEAVAKLEVN